MHNVINSFWSNESGATAIEYGLIASGIFLAIITSVGNVGTNLDATFNDLAGNL